MVQAQKNVTSWIPGIALMFQVSDGKAAELWLIVLLEGTSVHLGWRGWWVGVSRNFSAKAGFLHRMIIPSVSKPLAGKSTLIMMRLALTVKDSRSFRQSHRRLGRPMTLCSAA